MGVVWADRFIVQRLTDMVYLGIDSACSDDRIYRVARLFTAIRDFLKRLEEYYLQVDQLDTVPDSLQPNEPHPRFFPQCTQYHCRKQNKLVNIKYTRAIDDSDPANLTYVAETVGETPSSEVIVKFSDRYGYEPHQLLAEKGRAPELYYVGLLDGKQDVSDCEEARGSGRTCGLYNGPLRMIVMEHLDGKDAGEMEHEEWPTTAYDDVKAAVKCLHEAGFVFGDLRRPNVVFSPKTIGSDEVQAQLIDFDWAGREGEVYYPPGLSMNAGWTEGIESFKKIEKRHDMDMLAKHFG